MNGKKRKKKKEKEKKKKKKKIEIKNWKNKIPLTQSGLECQADADDYIDCYCHNL